ncbi:MAG TPA: flagellin [Opitutaceae bacterium]|nr:flagellin [Opitutaceae bacterium]
MSVVINTNSAATMAADNLASSTAMLQKSLNRLSSGSKIVSPADDAGGLAVSMKLSATVGQQGAIASNISNATSFLQTQDGVLATVGKILDRVSQLKTLSLDPTKNSSDIANYNDEFVQLQQEITSLGSEKFNGIALFGSSGLNIRTTVDSSAQAVNVGSANLLGTVPQTWNSIGMSASDWSTANGATNNGTTAVLPGTGEIFTSQSNVAGPLTLTFDATAGSTGGNLAFNGGGSGFGGPAVNDTSQHHYIVTDNGSQTTVSVDGTVVQTISASLGGSGGFLGISANAATFTITSLSLTNTAPGTSGNVANVTSAASLSSLNLTTVDSAIQDVATERANNGASQSRLGFSADVLSTNMANIQSANSRITDVDVASESTNLARYNILVQAGTAMLSQANQSPQVALKLLG